MTRRPQPSTPPRDLFGGSAGGSSNRSQYLVARLERRLATPFSSFDPEPEHTSNAPIDRPSEEGLLLALARGVTPGPEGEEAGVVALEALRDALCDGTPWTHEDPSEWERRFDSGLRRAFGLAEERLCGSEGPTNIPATLTVACIFWPRFFIAHVGDALALRVRHDTTEAFTTPHTVGQEFVDKGILTEREVSKSRFERVLWNVLGGRGARARPSIHSGTLQPGDRIVLMSDELAAQRSHDEIGKVVRVAPTARAAAIDLLPKTSDDIDAATAMAFFHQEATERVPLRTPRAGDRTASRPFPPLQEAIAGTTTAVRDRLEPQTMEWSQR